MVPIDDQLIVESVARQGGYEVVEQAGKWETVASAVGMRKACADEVKHRYEELLRASSELDMQEDEDEDEEYEVEAILDTQLDNLGNTEYLVKWKSSGEADGEHDDVDETWEPHDNLACPELLEHFEATRMRTCKAVSANASTHWYEPVGLVGAPRAGAGAVSSGNRLQFRKVVGAHSATEGKLLLFEVVLADGSNVIESSTTLRELAPQVLIDFYEERLRFE